MQSTSNLIPCKNKHNARPCLCAFLTVFLVPTTDLGSSAPFPSCLQQKWSVKTCRYNNSLTPIELPSTELDFWSIQSLLSGCSGKGLFSICYSNTFSWRGMCCSNELCFLQIYHLFWLSFLCHLIVANDWENAGSFENCKTRLCPSLSP